MQLTLDPLEETRQGWPQLLTLNVENPGPDLLVLEEASGSPLDGRLRWRECPLGVVLYHAGSDTYQHRTVLNSRAGIPIDKGLVAAGVTRSNDLQLKRLELGPFQSTVTVRGWRIPADEVGERVYLVRSVAMQATKVFEPYATVRAANPDETEHGLLTEAGIVRVAGCERVVLEATLEGTVVPDAEQPAAAALERVAGARLVQRSRRLRGAWILEDAEGATHLVRGEEQLRLGQVDAALWWHLDVKLPFEDVLVVFHGEEARGLAARHGRGEEAQSAFSPADLWGLLAEVGAAGLPLRWARQTSINHGLIIGRRDGGAGADA